MRRLNLGLVLVFMALGTTLASGAEFASVDRPGPPLSPSKADLEGSLKCDETVATSDKPPVLLAAGTAINTDQNFGWSYIPALRASGYPVCTVDQPGDAQQNMGETQTRGEYITHAIRQTYKLHGNRPISIIGYSQGGQVIRWPLRFWPDTRKMVDDLIAIAPTNHGSQTVNLLCAPNCAPTLWQQRDASVSRYIAALNSGQETFAGIDYTNAYTTTDEFVTPNLDDSGTSSLHTGDGRINNIAIQDVCPDHIADHLQVGTFDPVAWALAIDALNHDGPADPARINTDVCEEAFLPGVEPGEFMQRFGNIGILAVDQLTSAPRVNAEPDLKPYVFADYVPPTTAQTGTCATRSRMIRVGKRATRVRRSGKALKIKRGRKVRVRFTGAQTHARILIVRRAADGTRSKATRIVRRCTG
ncbi:MAG: hypothetical protein QOH75_3720 [Actinomycetota bacterium]|nr:hypothetical protein [Actinomycetota bacterium]